MICLQNELHGKILCVCVHTYTCHVPCFLASPTCYIQFSDINYIQLLLLTPFQQTSPLSSIGETILPNDSLCCIPYKTQASDFLALNAGD